MSGNYELRIDSGALNKYLKSVQITVHDMGCSIFNDGVFSIPIENHLLYLVDLVRQGDGMNGHERNIFSYTSGNTVSNRDALEKSAYYVACAEDFKEPLLRILKHTMRFDLNKNPGVHLRFRRENDSVLMLPKVTVDDGDITYSFMRNGKEWPITVDCVDAKAVAVKH